MKHSGKNTRASSIVTTRKIISGEHLNPNGTLFGGYLMSWMDEVAFVCARRFSGHPRCVTVNIDQVSFRHPVYIGEHLVLTAAVNCVGRTSMELYVKVECEDASSRKMTFTNDAHLTFVCLGEDGRPMRVPELVLESAEDFQFHHESQLRARLRKRLRGFLEKRSQSRFSLQKPEASAKWKIQLVLDGSLARTAKRLGFTSGTTLTAP